MSVKFAPLFIDNLVRHIETDVRENRPSGKGRGNELYELNIPIQDIIPEDQLGEGGVTLHPIVMLINQAFKNCGFNVPDLDGMGIDMGPQEKTPPYAGVYIKSAADLNYREPGTKSGEEIMEDFAELLRTGSYIVEFTADDALTFLGKLNQVKAEVKKLAAQQQVDGGRAGPN